MFGDNLKKARIAAGISQTKLARELHVTQGAISQWENGLTKPDTELLPLIADLLHISIDELMDRDGAIDDDTLALRERLRRDPDMRVLFSAAEKATPEHLRAAAAMLKALKSEAEDAD